MLNELLDMFGLTLEQLQKKGRGAGNFKEKKSDLITYLHEQGYSWAEMCDITGLGNATIQRLTKAKGCKAVQDKMKIIGQNAGASTKGMDRHEQLKRQWEKGDFEFHRGRVRPQQEKDKIKEAWKSTELRGRASENTKKFVWGNKETRKKLLDFHQNPTERSKRSNTQALRMKQNPNKYVRGIKTIEITPKGDRENVIVRSSYEAKTIKILESDPNVSSYIYEPIYKVGENTIIPDFLVTYKDGSRTLIEVKSHWALGQEKVIKRLSLSEKLATENGWGYQTWTEKELGYVIQRSVK